MLTQSWLANWYASDNICLFIGGDFGSCTCGYNSILTLEAYDDLSYISNYYKMGSLISKDQFEFLEMEICMPDFLCAVAIFQQPEYYNGTGRCWKKKLPLSHGRLNSNAVERKELFKKLKLNSSSQNPGQGKQNQAILILAILLEATGGFKEELGMGSFGTFYKGELASSHNKYVAVRKLDKKVREDGREFKIDVTMIGQTHHKNLVQLLGYCDEGED
ncbi:hypothetical protein CMV_014521 [Castanea mollissima]|uniref:Protein kinase domain-containing protein n=1 Tax=Castanea mollissima TaxID=60419 RepID=A0A8J4QXT1_9ROSI|nr:hypothetical protein CMV_014521 [Castanea mollissima]